MRNIEISVGEHYHIYNRGISSQNIFIDDADRSRFLFLLLHQQSIQRVFNAEKNSISFIRYGTFLPFPKTITDVVAQRLVELVNFAIMTNHFHLTTREVKENGISKYMHRVLMSYAKYFNAKYKKTGHVFEGTYKAVHVMDNSQILYLSAYLHKNPGAMREWRGREYQYPWSSFGDYVNKNRFTDLLKPEIILNQFDSGTDYKKFVEGSKAKELEQKISDAHFFDA